MDIATLDLQHDAEAKAAHADLRAAIRDIEQELMTGVETLVSRALMQMEEAGALDRWLQSGRYPTRCTAATVAAHGADEIATNAVEMLGAYRNADARDAFKMERES